MIKYIAYIKVPIISGIILAIVLLLIPISVKYSIGLFPFQATSLFLTGAIIFWAGWLISKTTNKTILSSSLSGPLVFAFSLAIDAIHRLATIPPDMKVSEDLFFGSPYIAILFVVLMGYCMSFPITMGIAALGAYIQRKHYQIGFNNEKIDKTPNKSLERDA